VTEDFNEPLLSADETDALLQAMRSGEGPTSLEVEGADLGSPDRPLRQALGRADRVTLELMPEIRKVMLRMAKCTATSEEQPAEIIPYNVLINAILPGSAIGTLRTNDDSLGLLIVGPSLASFIIERRLGAPSDLEDGAITNCAELSSIDRRVLQPCLKDICVDFSRLWTGNPEALQLTQVMKSASELPPFTQFEPLLRIGTRIVPSGGVGDEVIIAVTAGAVRATTAMIREASVQISPDDRARMVSRLSQAEVEIIALLGGTRSTIREVIDLKVGSILRLTNIPEEPIQLTVNGITKLLGRPVVHHGNLAVDITETL
jgi:flagellar motor switch protein FliM